MAKYLEITYMVFTGVHSDAVKNVMQENAVGNYQFLIDGKIQNVPFKLNSIEVKEIELEKEQPPLVEGTQTESEKENATNI